MPATPRHGNMVSHLERVSTARAWLRANAGPLAPAPGRGICREKNEEMSARRRLLPFGTTGEQTFPLAPAQPRAEPSVRPGLSVLTAYVRPRENCALRGDVGPACERGQAQCRGSPPTRATPHFVNRSCTEDESLVPPG